VALRLALKASGAGGLERDFESTGRHFLNENNFYPAALTTRLTQKTQEDCGRSDILDQAGTALTALNLL
jgi:hypothetical protein